MYHYIQEFNSKIPYMNFLQINDFRKQLDYFQNNFYFVSKKEFLNNINNLTDLPENSIVLTFDDGLKCHYEYVFKELKSRNLWGIFFISTKPYVDNDYLNVHKIHLLLGQFKANIILDKLREIVKPNDLISCENQIELDKLIYPEKYKYDDERELKKILNYFIKSDVKDKIINYLFNFFIKDCDINNFYLSKKEIKEMSDLGMIIGSHTVNHYVLSSLSYEQQEYEIKNSYDVLDSIIENNIHCFCFPYGGKNVYNNTTLEILKKYNTLFGIDVNSKDVEKTDDISTLPRYDCNEFKYGKIYNYKNT